MHVASRDKMENPERSVDAPSASSHENHKETSTKATKRAKDDKATAPKPKRRRVQSVSDKPTGRHPAGRKFKEKQLKHGKGKYSKRPQDRMAPFRFRHGGSISDPLNLQGKDGIIGSECSTCAPSPVDTPPLPSSPDPKYVSDPLNLKKSEKKEKQKNRYRKKHTQSLGDLNSGPGVVPSTPAVENATTTAAEDSTPGDSGRPCQQPQAKKPSQSESKDPQRFCYGNYNRYYGYRIGRTFTRDPRVGLISQELLEGKDVLDIGCNTGQVTVAVAKDFNPRCITGIDIDGNLIKTARKNILRSLPLPQVEGKSVKFPLAIVTMFGPLAAIPSTTSSSGGFPHNVKFRQENYVPSSDSHLEGITPEFDVIMALSLTKWIHLNWGDEGLKRAFRKMFKQLKPGGALILEVQDWDSYKRRRNLTPTISANYKRSNFKPDQFAEYLLSEEVGFELQQSLGVPTAASKGFSRPLELFLKASAVEGAAEDSQPKQEVDLSAGSESESESGSDSDSDSDSDSTSGPELEP